MLLCSAGYDATIVSSTRDKSLSTNNVPWLLSILQTRLYTFGPVDVSVIRNVHENISAYNSSV